MIWKIVHPTMEVKRFFFNLGHSCLWLFFYSHSLCFLKIFSRRKTSNYLCHLYSWSKRGKTISDIFFIGTFFLIFFLLGTKMDPKIIKVFSKKRSASSPDDEFKFQPEPEIGDMSPLDLDLGWEKMSYWWPSLVRRIEDSIIEVHLLPFSKTFKRERERGYIRLLRTMLLEIYVLHMWNSWLVTNLTSMWTRCLTLMSALANWP